MLAKGEWGEGVRVDTKQRERGMLGVQEVEMEMMSVGLMKLDRKAT